MPKKPVLSFVIPVYKKDPEVFRQCLRSLYDQSFKDFEVICVFDGEDDELAKVASAFPVQIVAIEHGGAPKARNAGLRLATGTYVVFWDADCFIKPEAASAWIQHFNNFPDVDFVYFGYELTGERGAHEAEPFDYYSLTCGNYICSMSPIKREKAHLWDESLDGAQDWDYFLTACERGLKGAWIQGRGFSTDAGGNGISSHAWSSENRKATIQKIKEKHGIPDRRIGVYSHQYADRALKLAKILEGDLIKPSGKSFEEYDLLIILGFGWASRFDGVPENIVKIQYWIPAEIEALMSAQYKTVMATVRISKTVINYCGTAYEKNRLAEIGITAEVLPLPLLESDLSKLETSLPEKFKVLLVADEAYEKLLKELPQDLPHVEFLQGQASVKDCSCLMSFYRFSSVDDAIVAAHVNGRNVISNVQAPYCGFIDPDDDYEVFKKSLYEKLREIKNAPFNKEAQEYYLDHASPRKFKETILAQMPKVLEVV